MSRYLYDIRIKNENTGKFITLAVVRTETVAKKAAKVKQKDEIEVIRYKEDKVMNYK